MGTTAEQLVVLHLALRCDGTDWIVRRALLEPGVDLIMDNPATGQRINVEVKSRQRLVSAQEPNTTVLYQMSANEYQHMDIAVCVFWDTNSIYVVPKDQWTVGGELAYWSLKRKGATGEVKPELAQYLDAWHLIDDDLGGS